MYYVPLKYYNKSENIDLKNKSMKNLLSRLKQIDLKLYYHVVNNKKTISEYYLRDLIDERAETISLNNFFTTR